MSNHDPLRDTLRNRADQLGDAHPLTLDDVKGRARGIRRRRTAVTGLAAAAVLAVAIPAGIAITDRVGLDPDRAPVAGPSVTPSEGGTATTGTTPAPTGPVRVELTTDRPNSAGLPPAIPFLADGSIWDGDDLVPVQEDYQGLAPVGGGWVAVRNDEGDMFVDLLDGEGEVLFSAPSTGSLAVSDNGTVAAYATPDGELVTVTPGGERRSLVNPEALPDGILEPVAVLGSDTCDPDSAGGGCVVFFNHQDLEEQGAWSATSKGIVSPFPDFLWLGGQSPDGSLSGVVSRAEDNSVCSAVLAPNWDRQLWETCDYELGQFSPDGRYVIGHPAYRSGFGDASVAILDAGTGDLLAEFTNSREHPASIFDVAWDADNTLVATVFETGTWALMRMTPEGKLTSLAETTGTEDPSDVPVVFATQP